MVDYSEQFYQHYARRYAEVAHQFLQSVYVKSSHPALKNDWDLLERVKELAPGKRVLDVGCGAGRSGVGATFGSLAEAAGAPWAWSGIPPTSAIQDGCRSRPEG